MKQLVFVSSVQKELAEERKAIRDFIEGNRLLGRHFDAFIFEDLPAKNRRPDDLYLDKVDACSVFVALFAVEYGWEDPTDGLSPTEREFNRATELGRHRLLFLKNADKDIKPHPKMAALTNRAKAELIYKRFNNTADLTSLLYDSLIEYLEERGIIQSKLARSVGTRAAGAAVPVTYEIPKEAIREIIVNAVAHRDYTSGAAVQVSVFADRLEVWNPGSLPRGLRPDDLSRPHSSEPSNPLIARPLYLAHYIENLGTGTLDVIRHCLESDLPPPRFEQRGSQFVVTLWRDWLTSDVLAGLNLNDRQRKAIAHVKTTGRIGNLEYQRLTGAIKKTATRDLDDLVAQKLLAKVGTTGRGVHYVIARKGDIKGTSAATTAKGDTKGTNETSTSSQANRATNEPSGSRKAKKTSAKSSSTATGRTRKKK